jgi:hypothetical protein
MFGQARPQFGRTPGKPQADDAPPPPARQLFRAEARRNGMLARARDMLGALPGPGESVHCLQTGYFDLLVCVPLLLSHYGPAKAVRLATLSYNGRNLTEVCRVLDEGRAERLTLLASQFFRNHNRELWGDSVRELQSRGQTVACAKTHAKVICLDFAAGVKLSLEGSANLRTNRSAENVTLIHDPGVHDWHAGWIDGMVRDYEREEAEEEK